MFEIKLVRMVFGTKRVEITEEWRKLHNAEHYYVFNHNRQNILPKGRSFTANSGTETAVLLKDRSSTANSGIWAAVLLRMDKCGDRF